VSPMQSPMRDSMVGIEATPDPLGRQLLKPHDDVHFRTLSDHSDADDKSLTDTATSERTDKALAPRE
jgi:hypothetical protein